MTNATLPKLSGFEEYFGIQVCAVGEDGDLVALGHHDLGRTVKAMNAYHRKVFGDDGLLGDDVDRLHARNAGPDAEDWLLETTGTPSRDTFPVMYWTAR